MTKSEFVDQVADSAGCPRTPERPSTPCGESIQEALSVGDDITFTGFGKFHVA